MDAAGAVELLMPALTPIGLFEQSGRIHAFGDVLIKFEVKRQNRKVHMALGPTHEETITDLVRASDFQLPADADHDVPDPDQVPQRRAAAVRRAAHQRIPHEGRLQLRRHRWKASNKSYETMYAAYCRIFERCGLDYLAVEAESGPIGGDASHEFMVLAENGEDTVLHCKDCGYAANQEKAEIGCRGPRSRRRAQAAPANGADAGRGHDRASQRSSSSARPQQMIKTLIYAGRRQADRRLVARRSRGQRGQGPPRGRGRQGRAGRPGGDRAGDRGPGRFRRAGRA